MFPENLFDFVLVDLAEALTAATTPPPNPLPCDRWIARSCLQKAIRRGAVSLAQRALANMFEYDRRAAWRAVVVIALEDVGVAGMNVLARVVAAAKNSRWRVAQGGDWLVACELVRQMAESPHCQATCDLLLRVNNDPALEAIRANALDADPDALISLTTATTETVEVRAAAALTLGGALVGGEGPCEPAAVFQGLQVNGPSIHVVSTCEAAWRLSQNPMALLLPLVWEAWMAAGERLLVDDDLPVATYTNGVPGYAVDQFTRAGGRVARSCLRANPYLRDLLTSTGITVPQQARAVGDLLFLVEGGLLRGRQCWALGDDLRQPIRAMPAVFSLGPNLSAALDVIRRQAPLIAEHRAEYLSITY